MIAVHFESRRASILKAPMPRRPEGYARIRLLCGGVCNTDLKLLRGHYAFTGTPGHEFVGEVIDADNPRLVGRRVVGEISPIATRHRSSLDTLHEVDCAAAPGNFYLVDFAAEVVGNRLEVGMLTVQ